MVCMKKEFKLVILVLQRRFGCRTDLVRDGYDDV